MSLCDELEAGLLRSQADSERLIRAVLTIVSEVDLFLDKTIDDVKQAELPFYPKYLTDEQYIDDESKITQDIPGGIRTV